MKRIFTTLLFALLLSEQVLSIDWLDYYDGGYSCSVKCSSGQTLYYSYNYKNNPYTAIVTCPYTVKSNTVCYYFTSTKPEGDLVIPEMITYSGEHRPVGNQTTFAVTEINNNAFDGCTKLTSVTIPNSVTKIGLEAFYGCSGLETVIVGNAVTSITQSAFSKCISLISIYIPNSVTSIEPYAFKDCKSLTSITIPASVSSIGQNAFANCSDLRQIICLGDIPASLEYGDPFPNNDTIYVPSQAVVAYEEAPIWNTKTIMPYYAISVQSENDSLGFIQCDSLLLGGKTITITAIPTEGYHLKKWSDGNTDNPRSFSAASDTSITAFFEAHTTVKDEAIEATCTKKGLTEGSHCSVCGVVIVAQDTISMLPHTEVIDVAVAATCTETGLTAGKHCSVCNATIVAQKEISALGHEFKNYIYNNDATTTADGTETAVCERGCGATDTRVKEGTKLATAVSESAANTVNIYAHGNTIVVENATEEIRVYNAMGALICRDAINRVRTEIPVNGTGVYIVKTGGVVKRVMVN
ncbi:MAG: leucine-rich repeat domain-containing protein [Salinivirgaceae bacterium]|nr:leucine-rich repeat domain-containing protein [Salinivirgaceae bacterium]